MTKLILSDLRHHWQMWLWTFIEAWVCSAMILGQLMVVRGSRMQALATGNQMLVEAADSLAPVTLALTGLTAIPVCSSVISLACGGRLRTYAQWEAAGMRPRMVALVLRSQAVVIALCASVASFPLSFLVAAVITPLLQSERVIALHTSPQWSLSDIGLTSATICIAAGFAAGGVIRQLRKQSLADLLRSQPELSSRPGVLRSLVRFLTASGMAAMVCVALLHSSTNPEAVANIAIFGAFSGLGFFITVGRYLTPRLEHVLGVVVLARGVCWHIATRSCSAHSAQSSGAVMPFTISMGLVGILFAMAKSEVSGMTLAGFLSIFGPPLLAAWVGGIGVSAISASRMKTDSALLIAAGAHPSQVRTIHVLQGVVHSVAAAIQALLATVIAVAIFSHAGILKLEIAAIPWQELIVTFLGTVLVVSSTLIISSRTPLSVGQLLRGAE